MAKPKKLCHYEVLGVSLNATDKEIRSTFRHLALRIHPDKQAANGVSLAVATTAFQDLLQAYQVLSDSKERSWYDSHISQILSSNPNSVVPSRSSYFSRHSKLDLERFFSPSCFSGFSDSGKGFFKVYGDAFNMIHSQELYFANKSGLGLDRSPPIGNVYSPYSEFMAFYNYWLGFSTVINFDWIYDQEEAKNDRNLMVRELVVLVKKLDKRIIDMKGKESEQDEKVREKNRLKKKLKAMRKKEEEKKFGKNNIDKEEVNNMEEEEEEEEEEESWYNTLSADQKRLFGYKFQSESNKKFTMEKFLQAMIKKMEKKKKKKFERMNANKENEIHDDDDDDDDDEEKKERDKKRSEGDAFDSKDVACVRMKNDDACLRNACVRMKNDDACGRMKNDDACVRMKNEKKKLNQRNEVDNGEDKKEVGKGKGKSGEGIYCIECKKYFSKFHIHLKSNAKSSKRNRRNRSKWNASEPLITNLAPLVHDLRPWEKTLLRRGHLRLSK